MRRGASIRTGGGSNVEGHFVIARRNPFSYINDNCVNFTLLLILNDLIAVVKCSQSVVIGLTTL